MCVLYVGYVSVYVCMDFKNRGIHLYALISLPECEIAQDVHPLKYSPAPPLGLRRR